MRIGLSVLNVIALSCLSLFSACSDSNQLQADRSLKMLIVSHTSTWGGGTEIEIKTGHDRGSILQLNSDFDAPIDSGKRAAFKVSPGQFERFQSAMAPLEVKAIDSEDVRKIDFAEYEGSLGFDCENRITDVSFVNAIWIYSDRSVSWASYYTGCDNDFSETISNFLTTEFQAIESGIPDSRWKDSKSRMYDFLE